MNVNSLKGGGVVAIEQIMQNNFPSDNKLFGLKEEDIQEIASYRVDTGSGMIAFFFGTDILMFSFILVNL